MLNEILRLKPLCASLTVIVTTAPLAIAASEDNLAHGKSYTLTPPPNYGLCTDPGDAKQLTDGEYTQGYFWAQKSTVGWQATEPVIVTIDLGRVEPVRGVSWSTAAGVAGVRWPKEISILVSDDGRNYYAAGELVTLSARSGTPPTNGYALHRFKTDLLKTHGRFVSLVVTPNESFCFVDEIEVLKGEADWVQLAFQGEAITDPLTYHRNTAGWRAIQHRLTADLTSLSQVLGAAKIPADEKMRTAQELDAISREMPDAPHTLRADFRAVLPLNALHERVFLAQARIWRAQGAAPLTVWQSPLWDPLTLMGPLPASAKQRTEVTLAIMQNEYRAAAFNLSWAGEHPAVIRAQILGLPGGRKKPLCVTVHEVAWTDTKEGDPVAAALPLAQREGDSFLFNLVPGLTRQVWLTFHPVDVPPGIHRGKILLSTGNKRLQVPLVLHIYPVRFPDRPTLHVGGWDYTDVEAQYDITPQNRASVIAHLREHFVDSPWATAAVLPVGRYDSEGTLVTGPDTTPFDVWLKRWPEARQYCVFAAVGDRFDGSPMGTPEFARKVQAWTRFWAGHAQRRGLKPEQLALLLVDEPGQPAQDAIILAWATAIHTANTGIKVWEDTVHADPATANQEMMRACDVLCPNRPMFMGAGAAFRDYYVRRRDQGAELAFYSCSGPVRQLDPYAYHRLQAWTCWQYGAPSSFFWAFGDSGGGSSWNEYTAPHACFVPFFLDPASVTPGKHMEALREGVEDFEYLAMLRDRIAVAERAAQKNDALTAAKKLLADAPRRVCEAQGNIEFRWQARKDRTLADQVRIEILEALTVLRKHSR
jgi:hypothetical protein